MSCGCTIKSHTEHRDSETAPGVFKLQPKAAGLATGKRVHRQRVRKARCACIGDCPSRPAAPAGAAPPWRLHVCVGACERTSGRGRGWMWVPCGCSQWQKESRLTTSNLKSLLKRVPVRRHTPRPGPSESFKKVLLSTKPRRTQGRRSSGFRVCDRDESPGAHWQSTTVVSTISTGTLLYHSLPGAEPARDDLWTRINWVELECR